MTHSKRSRSSYARRARPFASRVLAATIAATLVMAPHRADAQVTTSASGANAAAIQAAVDAYRLSLGPLRANVAGSFGSGRREINWDGVPDALSAPNNLPANFFNVNSPRGVVFSTPGSGFQVSGNAGTAPVRFDNINPLYSSTFSTFSAQRLFTAIGSNIVDVNFFVPGTATAALTRGFGAVFTDVDLTTSTSLQFFDAANTSLGTFSAAALAGSGTLSFLGILFNAPIVSRVRITSGNTALGASDQIGSSIDVVAMDDFIYGEPISSVVPEPGTYALVASGLLALGVITRRRRRA